MKKILIPALCLMLALFGCTPKADKATAAASDFLTAFFAMDIDRASSFCSDDIAAMLRDTSAEADYPSQEIRAKVVEASKNTTFKILSTEQLEESGEYEVKYEIHPYGAPKSAAIPRTMRLTRSGSAWKITALE